MNESCHTYEWVMSNIWISHVTHANASRHTCEWVMSHTWMSHVTHKNDWCHVTHMNESCRTYEWLMPLTPITHPQPEVSETRELRLFSRENPASTSPNWEFPTWIYFQKKMWAKSGAKYAEREFARKFQEMEEFW